MEIGLKNDKKAVPVICVWYINKGYGTTLNDLKSDLRPNLILF